MKSNKDQRKLRMQKKQQRTILNFLVAGGFLLILAGFFIAKTSAQNRTDPSLVEVNGQPSLKVDQELIDYGDVKFNTNLAFTIRLTNVGDKPLKISEAPFVEVVEGC